MKFFSNFFSNLLPISFQLSPQTLPMLLPLQGEKPPLSPVVFHLAKTLWLRCRVRQRHPLRRHHHRPSSKSDCLLFIRNVDADFFFTLEIPRNVTCLTNLWESGTDIPKASIHPYHFAEYFLKLAWWDVVPAGVGESGDFPLPGGGFVGDQFERIMCEQIKRIESFVFFSYEINLEPS